MNIKEMMSSLSEAVGKKMRISDRQKALVRNGVVVGTAALAGKFVFEKIKTQITAKKIETPN